ncbi:MAG: ABC transporter ATP-binding protein [Elusimicrobiales bacterium]|nr:ABC transporter ATP-binding protein [Elusimicrobiales bacterium]
MNDILKIDELVIELDNGKNKHILIDSVSINIPKNKITAIVGESGSGKTMTFLSVIGLLPEGIYVKSGDIIFDSCKIINLSEKDLRKIRGREIFYIFQEPMTALDPVFNIESQMIEILLSHNITDYSDAKKIALAALKEVGIEPTKIKSYPHNFSGGQLQRILIAMAIMVSPKLIIADEPTTSLDVVTQLEILNLLKNLTKQKNISIVLISHNIGIVYNYSDYVYVMYLGQIVEEGVTCDVVENPVHPYTEALINSIIKMGVKQKIKPIEGIPGEIYNLLDGCRFYDRCSYRIDKCKFKPPKKSRKGGYYYCWVK